MTSSTSPITAMRPSARVLITLLAALSMVFAQLIAFAAPTADAATGGSPVNPSNECSGLTYLDKWEFDDQGDGGEWDQSGSTSRTGGSGGLTVDYEVDDGEVFEVSWTSDEPIFRVWLKAGRDTDEGVSYDGAFSGTESVTGNAFSHITFCTDDPDPTVTVGFTKAWTGADEGDAVAELKLTADDGTEVATITDGDTLDLTDYQGQELGLEEVLTTALPENCDYTTDLDETYTVPTATDTDITDTITATNTVTCTDDPDLTPGIGIVKTAVSADVDFTFSNGTLTVLLTEGESAEITYEYLITNEGDEDLDTLGLEDDVIGDLTDEFVDAVDDEYGETFPVGGEVTVTATYTTTADDFDTGSVTNVATVTGTGVTSGDNVDAEDDETIDIAGVLGVVFEPGISVEKTAIGGVSDNVVVFNADGDAVAVTYQFVVTNTGDEDLDSLTVIDDKIGDLTEAFLAALGGTVLPVGASVTFTAVHEVVIDDFKDDSLTNVVEATGVGVESRGAVDDDDSETISFTQVAGVVIVDDSQPVATEATTLPRTGFDTGVLAGLGLLLAALGAAALLLGRRREEGDLS